HRWRPSFSSSITYGVVTMHNLVVQTDDAVHRTQRATAYVTWNPITRADLVFEFLTGERVNKDGERGTSSQIQAGWKVHFGRGQICLTRPHYGRMWTTTSIRVVTGGRTHAASAGQRRSNPAARHRFTAISRYGLDSFDYVQDGFGSSLSRGASGASRVRGRLLDGPVPRDQRALRAVCRGDRSRHVRGDSTRSCS